MIEKLRDLFGFLRFVVRRWNDDRCPLIAGSLTYTTILALAPMFVVGVAVLSSAPFFEDVMIKFRVFLQLNLTPELATTIINQYIPQLARNAHRLTAVGGLGVLIAAVWMLLTIDRTLNAIWRVRRTRTYWVSIPGYIALILAGPVLIGVGVTATTYLLRLRSEVNAPAEIQTVFLHVVPTAMSTLTFFLVYRIIPHRRVPWRHALVGALLAGVLFELAKELFEIYVHATPSVSRVYGALAAVPLFLVWLYFSWLVVLLGAEFTACAPYWQGNLWKEAQRPGVRFREALAITQVLLEAGGGPLSFNALAERTRLPAEEVEETIFQMIDGGVVQEKGREYEITAATKEVLATRPKPQPANADRS
ncbi:MAG TPA: YihY family inner membrane protein [Usitatibacter sp.]|nr:YihY family inner membrane protein [Usitatibacter sp.]